MKNRKALALIAILAIVAVACGGSSAASDDALVLGTLMPLTGDLGFLGPGIETGAILAVEQINAAGGVNGQDVVWVQGDSGTAPDVASASLATLIGEGVALTSKGLPGHCSEHCPDIRVEAHNLLRILGD